MRENNGMCGCSGDERYLTLVIGVKKELFEQVLS